MQFRHLKSLPDLMRQNAIAAFMNKNDANIVKLNDEFFQIIVDKRRPPSSIEVYFDFEKEEYKKRIEEQKEFDKILNEKR